MPLGRIFCTISLLWLGANVEIEAQTMNRVVVDSKINKEVLIGACDRSGLQLPVFESYYSMEYKQYEPDLKVVQMLRQLKADWHVVIVLGTWCSDTQRELPRFFRIMDECGFTDKMVTMYGVGRDKTAGDIDISSFEISLVPSFIFYRGKREIGRIVESPLSSLEKEMLILLAQPPKPIQPGSLDD